MNDGIAIVLARMESHPEEFYTTATDKWKFIYSEYFKDAMTETEKGMIYDKIKEIRKAEFTAKVMLTMTADITETEPRVYGSASVADFGFAPIAREGKKVVY
jgi:hypothetical protein